MSLKYFGVFFVAMFFIISCSGSDTGKSIESAVQGFIDGDKTPDLKRTETLQYFTGNVPDEGGQPWGDGGENHSPMIATLFKLKSYPATLSKVEFFVKNETGAKQMFHVLGYGNLEYGVGMEDFKISNQVVPVTGPSGAWVSVDLANYLVKGDIWIAMEWQSKPLASKSGKNTFELMGDAAKDFPAQQKWSVVARIWTEAPSTSSLNDAMVRLTYKY